MSEFCLKLGLRTLRCRKWWNEAVAPIPTPGTPRATCNSRRSEEIFRGPGAEWVTVIRL